MSAAVDRREKKVALLVPVLIVLLGCGATQLPPAALGEALAFLTAWSCLSLPLAVLVGHCALSED
jgi:hypothetical protein